MTEKTYPVTASEGGDNTAFVRCRIYNASRHYAVCLRIINRKESGDALNWEVDCNRAIACGECPAVPMRDEELQAGRALYYTPRDTSHLGKTTIFDKSYQRGWGSLDKIKRNQPKEAPVAKSAPKRKPKSSGSMHADLVNKLMDEEKKGGKQPKGS